MKSYKDIRKEMGDSVEVSQALPMPCSTCGASTPHETLRNFGARCGLCFAFYSKDAFSDERHAEEYKAGLARAARRMTAG